MRLYLSILLLLPLYLAGQNRTNGWRSHVSFNPVICVTETAESMVGATSNCLLLVSKNGTQITSLTKVEGLAETGITAIAYSAAQNCLLIGYESGNLDLIQNRQIQNFPDLTRKIELPDKTIHRIVCEGNFAYLCCAFGIVKVDLQRMEVAETWYLGSNNDLREAFDLTSFNGEWWVATNRGVLKASKQGNNLQDFRNWQVQTAPQLSDATFTSFAQTTGLLLAHNATSDQILSWNGSDWQSKYPEIKKIRSIKSSASGLIIVSANEVRLYGNTGNSSISSYSSENGTSAIDPRDAITDGKGELWIADYHYGLTHRKSSSAFEHILQNTPGSDEITALKAGPEEIFAATVTTNADGTTDTGYSIWQAGIWQNFTATEDAGLRAIHPITSFAIRNDNPDEYWAGTAGSGVLRFLKNRVATRYNETNSSLGSINQLCIVDALALDSQNNLWFSNPTGKAMLGTQSASGIFSSLPYPGLNFSIPQSHEMVVTSSMTHWVVLPNEGLFAFKINGSIDDITDDKYRKISVQSRFSNGATTQISQFTGISAISEDLDHHLWVGTSTGVVVYNNPDKVFEPGEFYGIQPSLDDGEALFKPILEKERITAIAVDGGSRKWIGTMNSGVFLFTKNGDRLLHHFDSKNSPLLSDRILSIAIAPGSGEVFFATNRGLISYLGEAIASNPTFDKVYVWPNPLKETNENGVKIDGLTDNTEVKVTDITGNLVYQTTSEGGRALWNGKNRKGNRVSTGVYLIYCHSSQLGISKIIKLLVIH